MPIRAVIFDCFGVLATEGLLPFRRRYFANNPTLMEEASTLGRQVDAGLADYGAYIARLAELAGISPADVRAQIERNVPDGELFTWIAQGLKPRYKIGVLSNAGRDWPAEIFTPAQNKLFDAVALSFQTGFPKPDPRAYELIARQLGAAPKECIFIDDQEHYCAAARQTGMSAVWYKDPAQCKRAVEKLLADSEK